MNIFVDLFQGEFVYSNLILYDIIYTLKKVITRQAVFSL